MGFIPILAAGDVPTEAVPWLSLHVLLQPGQEDLVPGYVQAGDHPQVSCPED